MIERKRRMRVVLAVVVAVLVWSVQASWPINIPGTSTPPQSQNPVPDVQGKTARALDVLATLPVRGRAPKTDYAREQFGAGWAEIDGCDMRNIILQRDLDSVKLSDDGCVVLSGTLQDPYAGTTIAFVRGSTTSAAVQIDHVVALSDAWQKGAQTIDVAQRTAFANDPLNLLAVDGPTNQKKGDGDAATWLPPDRTYRCRYVARQIAVKQSYSLWITPAEQSAMKRVLTTCPDQMLPLEVLPENPDVSIPPVSE